jgi:hypothetical protein
VPKQAIFVLLSIDFVGIRLLSLDHIYLIWKNLVIHPGRIRMKKRLFVAMFIIFFIVVVPMIFAKPVDAPRMTKDELKGMLGNPDLVIIDVRTQQNWADSDLKIKGAAREDPESLDSWANKYPKDKTLVLYCA